MKKVTLVALMVSAHLMGTSALASDGFGDGSFGDDAKPPETNTETAAPTASPKPTVQKPAQNDNLVGSFGETKPKPDAVAKPATKPATNPDDGFGEEGSFVENDNPPKPVKPKPEKPKPVKPKPVKPVKPRDPILAFEMRNFGVRPTGTLRRQQMHAPTPTAIPGGKVISTMQLFSAMKSKQQMILIDVLGGSYTLPNSYVEQRVAYGGNYRDRIQQQTASWLKQLTRGNRGMPIVLFCSDPMCWLSYNASLRSINAGFTNVYWYRGGKKAWQMAGHQSVPTGF